MLDEEVLHHINQLGAVDLCTHLLPQLAPQGIDSQLTEVERGRRREAPSPSSPCCAALSFPVRATGGPPLRVRTARPARGGQTPRGLKAPGLFQELRHQIYRNLLETHEDRRIRPVMIGKVEGGRIGLEQELAVRIVDLDRHRLAVFLQAGQESFADVQGGRPIRGSFRDTR